MKRFLFAAASALALSSASIAAPVSAQTMESKEPTAEELAALGGLFGDFFGEAEPLTEGGHDGPRHG